MSIPDGSINYPSPDRNLPKDFKKVPLSINFLFAKSGLPKSAICKNPLFLSISKLMGVRQHNIKFWILLFLTLILL
ncbi:MAG: hypothetical protein ACM3VV_04020 [Deltaproteobacteria bacterium]